MKKPSYYLLYHKFSVFILTAVVVMVVVANEQLIKISPSLKNAAMSVVQKLMVKKFGLLEGGKNPLLHVWFGNWAVGTDAISEVLVLKKDFTVEVIVKPGEEQGSYAHIIGNHPGYNYFEGFAMQQEGDNQNFYTFGFGNGKQWLSAVRFRLAAEEWNYIAVVTEGSRMLVYINGSLKTSEGAGGCIKNSGMPVQIGNWINHDRPFKGKIYEVRILNHALSEGDVRRNWTRINEKLK